MTGLTKSFIWCASLGLLVLAGCRGTRAIDGLPDSRLSSFYIGQFKPKDGDPKWQKMQVALNPPDTDKSTVVQSFSVSDFSNGTAANVRLHDSSLSV